LYWTAWAQNRRGNRNDALKSLETLRQSYPKSQWIDDAKVLAAVGTMLDLYPRYIQAIESELTTLGL